VTFRNYENKGVRTGRIIKIEENVFTNNFVVAATKTIFSATELVQTWVT
jgi:hypothetical protein